MLRIWGRRNSANVQKVLWLAEELGLEYDHVPAGGSFGRTTEPSFLTMNPHGRVPVLQDGELTIWESHSILRYLAAQYGDGGLFPYTPAERSQVEEWMDWAQTSFQPAFLNGVFWTYYRTPEAQRDWPTIKKNIARCGELLQLIDSVMKDRAFLAGGRFSLAEIPLGTLLYRYFELDIDRPVLKNIGAWYAMLTERAAYRNHVMVAFDDLRGRPAY